MTVRLEVKQHGERNVAGAAYIGVLSVGGDLGKAADSDGDREKEGEVDGLSQRASVVGHRRVDGLTQRVDCHRETTRHSRTTVSTCRTTPAAILTLTFDLLTSRSMLPRACE